MARVETLLDFSALDAELLPDQKELHAEDVEIFLEVLIDEATDEGIKAYDNKMADLPDDEYPWTAVRARHYWQQDDAFSDAEKLIRRGPPALSLALARRPDLEPELAGDEIPDPGTPEWDGFWKAMAEWQVMAIREAMGPVGWIPTAGDPDTQLDPVDPPEDPVILPEGEEEPSTDEEPEPAKKPKQPKDDAPKNGKARPSPPTPPKTPETPAAKPEEQPAVTSTRGLSTTQAVLISGGVVAGLGVLGTIAYLTTRGDEG